MEICALIGFYQEEKAGPRLLKNLEEMGIPSLWADSRLEGFYKYNNSDTSTDSFPVIIEESKTAKLYRLGLTKPGEGMNFLLREAAIQGYRYTITLGSDEWLEGDLDIFMDALERLQLKEPTKMRMPLVEHNLGGTNWGGHITERIVYLPEYVFLKDVHYVYWHNYYGYDVPMAATKRTSPLVLGLTVHHDDRIRDAERNRLMDEYQMPRKTAERDSLVNLIKNNEI